MKNGNITEFLDLLNYGQELLFVYNGKKYFIQGWQACDVHYMVLNYYEEADKNDGDLWKYSANDMKKYADAFLKLPIFDGKIFMEIEEYATWFEDW